MAYIPPFLAKLGLDAEADERAVRRAYARLLKGVDPEADPAGFQDLRAAYEAAMAWSQRKQAVPRPIPTFHALPPDGPSPAPLQDEELRQGARPLSPFAPAEPREPEPASPRDLAAQVFSPFREMAFQWSGVRTAVAEATAKFALEQCLQDDRLVNLSARWAFEQMVADLLVEGSFPARLLLFHAAARVFGWSKDRRRLDQFGTSGRKLNQEIDAGALGARVQKVEEPARARTPPGKPYSGWRESRPLIKAKWAWIFVIVTMLRVLSSCDPGGGSPPPPPLQRPIQPTRPTLLQPPPKDLELLPLPGPPKPVPPPSVQDPALTKALQDLAKFRGSASAQHAPPALPQLKGTPLSPPAPSSFKEGSELLDKHEWDRAITAFTQAIEANPRSAAAYNNRGNAWLGKRDYDRAIQDYSSSILANPSDGSPFYNRSLCWASKGQPDKALADLNEALRVNPGYAKAYRNRGRIRMEQGDLDGAIADFGETIRKDPMNALAHLDRGKAWALKGRRDLSEQDFQTAVRLDSTMAYLVPYEFRPKPPETPAFTTGQPMIQAPTPGAAKR